MLSLWLTQTTDFFPPPVCVKQEKELKGYNVLVSCRTQIIIHFLAAVDVDIVVVTVSSYI